MSAFRGTCVVFEPEKLLPAAWRDQARLGPVRTFNPGLLRDPRGDGWLLAYRVVAPDGARRIGICRLNAALEIVPDSAVAMSDHVRFRAGADYPAVVRGWFADPRLYHFGGRVWIYWNSGWHEPRNHQFLQELDPTTLHPLGAAREMLLRGERQKLEKNWTLFGGDERSGLAVYSIIPHRVLQFSFEGDGDIPFEEVHRHAWTLPRYPACHGGLRGGAPPVAHDGAWWSFCHSVHDGTDGYRYAPAVYAFKAQAPFRPIAAPVSPLALGNPFGGQRVHARLNPAVGEVIYPCGAARDGARWIVSHGLNDEFCALSLLSHDDVLETVESVQCA